jgi:hypothetical protein
MMQLIGILTVKKNLKSNKIHSTQNQKPPTLTTIVHISPTNTSLSLSLSLITHKHTKHTLKHPLIIILISISQKLLHQQQQPYLVTPLPFSKLSCLFSFVFLLLLSAFVPLLFSYFSPNTHFFFSFFYLF